MIKDLVSILTPCYNSETFIHRLFDSILAQDYSMIEFVLIDDGSTDNTQRVVDEYKSALESKCYRFVYKKVPHGGQAQAINYGLKIIQGEYLIWPDSDDYISSDSISKRVEFLKQNPRYDFVRSNGQIVDFDTLEKIYRISNAENRFKDDIYLDLINETTYCACGCYMIKTELLFDIYPNKTIYVSQAGQNWQLLIPYAGKFKCGYIDDDMYFITIRKNSHSRSAFTIEEEYAKADRLRDVLENIIPLTDRNEFDYELLLNKKYYVYKFLKAYEYFNKNYLKQYYNLLKNNDMLTQGIKLMYLELTHPYMFFILQKLYRLIGKGNIYDLFKQ